MAEVTDTPDLIDVETLMLQRLLRLFPHRELKEAWPGFYGVKDQLIKTFAVRNGFERINTFVANQCRTCKQHVYLFTHSTPLQDLPRTLISDLTPIRSTAQQPVKNSEAPPEPPLITDGPQRTDVYIAEGFYTVYLRDPMEEKNEPHFWPIMVQVTGQFCLIRFVKLQKNLQAEFGDRHIRSLPFSLTEEDICWEILRSLEMGKGWAPVDLNASLKALVRDNRIDANKVQLQDGHVTSMHELDAGKMIKQDLSPEQQKSMLLKPNLIKMKAQVTGWQVSIPHFFCTPASGFVNFSTYRGHSLCSPRNSQEY